MPEKNERECGAAGEIRPRMELEGAADHIVREIRPRMELEGAADHIVRVDPGRAHSHGACVDAGIVHEFKL